MWLIELFMKSHLSFLDFGFVYEDGRFLFGVLQRKPQPLSDYEIKKQHCSKHTDNKQHGL